MHGKSGEQETGVPCSPHTCNKCNDNIHNFMCCFSGNIWRSGKFTQYLESVVVVDLECMQCMDDLAASLAASVSKQLQITRSTAVPAAPAAENTDWNHEFGGAKFRLSVITGFVLC
jgi:hypothetical protein